MKICSVFLKKKGGGGEEGTALKHLLLVSSASLLAMPYWNTLAHTRFWFMWTAIYRNEIVMHVQMRAREWVSWHVEVQKHMLHLSPSLTFLDSNTQALVPSSSTLFHHRSPTSNLPVTFFTVQKSNAKSRTMVRNSSIKWPETKNGMRRYTSSAEARKKTWKNAARGCLENGWINYLLLHLFI